MTYDLLGGTRSSSALTVEHEDEIGPCENARWSIGGIKYLGMLVSSDTVVHPAY